MVDTDAIRAEMARKGLTQEQVAKMLGITAETFRRKMILKKFGTDEAEKLIPILSLENPEKIFFKKN